MTGFASACAEAPSATGAAMATVTAELRSVNGRFLDLGLRLPDELRALEPAFRDLIGAAIRRGKVELRVATAQVQSDPWPMPAPDQLHRLAHLESQVQAWMPQARALSVNEALHWCRNGAPATKLASSATKWWRRYVVIGFTGNSPPGSVVPSPPTP